MAVIYGDFAELFEGSLNYHWLKKKRQGSDLTYGLFRFIKINFKKFLEFSFIEGLNKYLFLFGTLNRRSLKVTIL